MSSGEEDSAFGAPPPAEPEPAGKTRASLRHRLRWVRWAVLALVLVVLSVEVIVVWPRLSDTWHQLNKVRWQWILACLLAVFFSFYSYAQVSRVLLRSAGVRCTLLQNLGLQFASNAVSQSLPGGQVLSPTMVYRRTRMWGASRVIATWQIVMSGLLMSAGLAVLGLFGALLAGAKTSPYSVVFSVALLIAFVAMAQYVASHPDGIYTVGARLIRWYNDLRNKDEDFGLARWQEILDQLGAVKLDRRHGALAFGWSMFNWVADVACLAFACYAVGGAPGLAALSVAYATSKAVNSISPIPGGIGLVEATLTPALVLAGMPAGAAFTATLIYRLISFFLVVAIGWVVFFVGYRKGMAHDPDAEDPTAGEIAAGNPAADEDTDPGTVAGGPGASAD
jgi:uncharacterized protein (TIRG00374 family)